MCFSVAGGRLEHSAPTVLRRIFMLRRLSHALVATVLAVIMLPAVAGAHEGGIPPAIPGRSSDYSAVYHEAVSRSGDPELSHRIAADVTGRGTVWLFMIGRDTGVLWGTCDVFHTDTGCRYSGLGAVVVPTAGLNVRTAADPNATVAYVAPAGWRLELTGETLVVNGVTWWQLTDGNWVQGQFLKFS